MPLLLGHLPRIHPPLNLSASWSWATNPLKDEPVLPFPTRTPFQSTALADFAQGHFSTNGIYTFWNNMKGKIGKI
jgi:hypothetical protein